MGLAQGYSAILVPKLVESNFASISESSWIASLGVISNPLGALIAGSFAEWFGRRSAIAFATLPHAAGWLIIALSTNVTMLCTGRFISGIGTGMANGLYLYVSEVKYVRFNKIVQNSFFSFRNLKSYTQKMFQQIEFSID